MHSDPTTHAMTALITGLTFGLVLLLALRLVVTEQRAHRLAGRLAAAERDARTDPLTRLANRNGLAHTFAALRATAAPGDHTALILLDLDQLKPINDTHGHDAGDHVLREIAHRIALPAPRVACAARLGGDEFVVLFTPSRPGDAVRHAAAHAATLRRRILAPIAVGTARFSVTCSAGIAALPTADLSPLLTAADGAMYRAKHAHAGIAYHHAETGTAPEPPRQRQAPRASTTPSVAPS